MLWITMQFTKVYHFADKSTWGDGQWQHEPDKCLWQDKTTDYHCCIRRSPGSGSWNGYCAVRKDHPCAGLNCDDEPVASIDIHGGLTYTEAAIPIDEHGGDPNLSPEYRIGDPEWAKYALWVFGFDCAHVWDLIPSIWEMREPGGILYRKEQPKWATQEVYRDWNWGTEEVKHLANQFAEAARG